MLDKLQHSYAIKFQVLGRRHSSVSISTKMVCIFGQKMIIQAFSRNVRKEAKITLKICLNFSMEGDVV